MHIKGPLGLVFKRLFKLMLGIISTAIDEIDSELFNLCVRVILAFFGS